jgi:hypothetical protein
MKRLPPMWTSCRRSESSHFAQDEVKAWAYTRSVEKALPLGPQVFVGADALISIPAPSIDLPLIDIL